jgi:hypothetical protein
MRKTSVRKPQNEIEARRDKVFTDVGGKLR